MKCLYLVFIFSIPAAAQTAGTDTVAASTVPAWQPAPVILFGHPVAEKETWEKRSAEKPDTIKAPVKAAKKKKKKAAAVKPDEDKKEEPPAVKKLIPFKKFNQLDPCAPPCPCRLAIGQILGIMGGSALGQQNPVKKPLIPGPVGIMRPSAPGVPSNPYKDGRLMQPKKELPPMKKDKISR